MATYTYTARPPTSIPVTQYWDQAYSYAEQIEDIDILETKFEFPNGRAEGRLTENRKGFSTIDPDPFVTEQSVHFGVPNGWFGPYRKYPPYETKYGGTTTREGIRLGVRLALTGNARDAVYAEETSFVAGTTILKFRDIVLGSFSSAYGSYLADASPTEDVFFARSDLSLVIHEPRSSGMPRIAIPPHVIRLLVAAWM